ncbi:MAG: glycosyltransferase family protein [Flavobacteriales bacterium]
MRILYAIQGTGNGHLSRAIEIAPALKARAHTDILVSGIQSEIDLPFEVGYRFYGLSFIFGKNGGVDITNTWRKSRLKQLIKDIREFPIEQYDLVISDFEPVSCWSAWLKGVPVVSLSNQAAAMAKGSPQPFKFDPIGKLVLSSYAPCSRQYGFHFQRYNPGIFTPIIRKEVRQAEVSDKGHYVIYLPSFSEEKIIESIVPFQQVEWHIFSKHAKSKSLGSNYVVEPIERVKFLESMASCSGIICGAGFATPGEALFLRKKLMVIPMKSQYEQQCNALALKQMGVQVIQSLKRKNIRKIEDWINHGKIIEVDYPDETEMIVDKILRENLNHSPSFAF